MAALTVPIARRPSDIALSQAWLFGLLRRQKVGKPTRIKKTIGASGTGNGD
jgi:hypothetical protein